MSRGLDSAVHLVQQFLSCTAQSGGTFVDATAGRGNDTLFMARLAGPDGRVFSFDIQEDALQSTRLLLEDAGMADRVTLVKDSHEHMERYVSGPVDRVIFNLGYLPGGEHSFITKADSTVPALQSALGLLRPGGRIGLVLYTGHPGGREEYEAVEKISAGLDNALFSVIKIVILNRAATAPVVIVIEKAGVK
ncbi:MAG: class I SAM-dependent methyltransferase [Desulfotomaculaceae bacterium]|nr:class I SAM-dependent methyltransferase [Desulfotomaculaceae bacterium]MDD4766937.1 class I SAM-dependent methyltransferase [Desulfotomaculaceae bacterium]